MAANHFVIVERRHENHALLFGELGGICRRLVEHITVQHHIGTVCLGGVNLKRRSDGRHADGGLGPTLTGRIGHTLGVIARGRGDDASSQLLVGQGGDLVVGAADLERSGDLKILRLEQNLMSGHFGQRRRRNDFRMACGARESFGGQFQFSCVIALQCFENLFLFHERNCKRTSAEVAGHGPAYG